jgi:xylan 1,4-beta-xylosidase
MSKSQKAPLKTTNYLTTATDIRGRSDPIKLNGVGFDASLFHDEDGRKYLVQQTWDHREYHHPFDGITLTDLIPAL